MPSTTRPHPGSPNEPGCPQSVSPGDLLIALARLLGRQAVHEWLIGSDVNVGRQSVATPDNRLDTSQRARLKQGEWPHD